MKKLIIIFSLVLLMILSFSVYAFANDSYVTYHYVNGYVEIGMGTSYSATDLFDEFKSVMPGDTLTEKVTLSYDGSNLYKARIYLKCSARDLSGVKLLEKLRLRATVDGNVIFDENADYSTGLEYLHLVTLGKGESREMLVTLTVPTDLDNTFEKTMGEIDWEFLVEEIPTAPEGGHIVISPSYNYVSYKVLANYYLNDELQNPLPLTLFAYRFAHELPTLEEVVLKYSDAHKVYGDKVYSYSGTTFDSEKKVFTLRYDRKTEPEVPPTPPTPTYFRYRVTAKYLTNGALDGTVTLFSSADVEELPQVAAIADTYSAYNEYLGKEYEYKSISFDGENAVYEITFERDFTPEAPPTPPTGDNSMLSLWIGMFAGAFVMMLVLIVLVKKKKDEKK